MRTMRRNKVVARWVMGVFCLVANGTPEIAAQGTENGEWRSYGG